MDDDLRELSRQQVSVGVSDLGWRFVLGVVRTCVRVTSMAQAAEVAAKVGAVAGSERVQLDLRSDVVTVTVRPPRDAVMIDLAGRISAALKEIGLATESAGVRAVQVLEIAIDALDIAAVKPFWAAVLGYREDDDEVTDPLGQGPAVWFQQMDAPRPQRNRIHFDIAVPHDEAQRRIEAALAAGGTLVSSTSAPAFWILADAEGNEACVTTWQGRD